MNNLSFEEFNLILKDFQNNIIGCRINNITLVNSRDFILSLSMVKEEKLMISLNHSSPFACLIKTSNVPSTIIGSTNDTLRKYIRDAFIVNVSLINEDRVIKFELQKANELYEKERLNLYIECIPQRPNLIITNENNIILYAMHYSSVTSSRCIVKNLEYIAPNGNLKKTEKPANLLENIKEMAVQYYKECLETRSKEKFNELFKFIKIRIKSLTKKLNTLENANNEAKEKLNSQEIGSMILALSYDTNELSNYIKENNLSYDEKLTPGLNAEKYFKKYKKAKRTLEMNEIERVKTIDEIKNLNFVLSSSSFMTEEELVSLSKQYLPNKYKNVKIKNEPKFIGSIVYKGNKISYGKNAKANAVLTFKLSNKADTYLHIKDTHGSHVVIHSDKFDDDTLLFAAELALIVSHQEVGEVYYTEIKNVKKGSSLGEANLLTYKTILIKNIRESSKNLLNK